MSNLKVSQGFEVLRPKYGQAMPIPCNEWDVLKNKIIILTTEPWFFQATGSTFIGASLATFISIITGAVASEPEKNTVIAWAVTVSCAGIGGVCLLFGLAERKAHKSKAAEVISQMELIEQRFERENL